jgi:aspartyl/asparaginyl-tRNA synthetase
MCEQIPPEKFNIVVQKLRHFFLSKGFIEVHTQSQPTILAACEDPKTVSTFEWNGLKYALPQTGQMLLENHILSNQGKHPGYFCLTTSYRQEPKPIKGRHLTIFPLFEFETYGEMEDLIELEKELLISLGYSSDMFVEKEYRDLMVEYNTQELDAIHEMKMNHDYSPVVFLKNFPKDFAYWNMKLHPDKSASYKIDVILSGMETFGSAARSCNIEEMRQQFDEISDGEYKKLLYDKFGKDRVEKEMTDYLSHDFFPRIGGGIGLSRLIRSMEILGILNF